jgi:hypothetical protein
MVSRPADLTNVFGDNRWLWSVSGRLTWDLNVFSSYPSTSKGYVCFYIIKKLKKNLFFIFFKLIFFLFLNYFNELILKIIF